MTRAKVQDGDRRRIAQACERCKQRKQKCSGQSSVPCLACAKRKEECVFLQNSDHEGREQDDPARKKRRTENTPPTPPLLGDDFKVEDVEHVSRGPACELTPPLDTHSDYGESLSSSTSAVGALDQLAVPHHNQADADVDKAFGKCDLNTPRMLLVQGNGRYVGETSSLAFLPLVRIAVWDMLGKRETRFTDYEERWNLMETSMPCLEQRHRSLPLPHPELIKLLADEFLVHTCGMIDFFDRAMIDAIISRVHENKPEVGALNRCLLLLILATGLLLATPARGSPHDALLGQFREAEPLAGDSYYTMATAWYDESKTTDLLNKHPYWAIQAQAMMSLYSLVSARRNRAYEHLAAAVASAQSQALHRTDFGDADEYRSPLEHRRRLWRSLYIMDRFISASLGRSPTINKRHCSDMAFDAYERTRSTWLENVHRRGIDASVITSHLVGRIMDEVYFENAGNVMTAKDMLKADPWEQELHAIYRNPFQGIKADEQSKNISLLHVHLWQLHSKILLTRNFFLFIIWREFFNRLEFSLQGNPGIEMLSRDCVVASYQTVDLIRKVQKLRHMSQRDPFVVYFLFSAALVILSNKCFNIFRHDGYDATIADVLEAMKYCSSEPLATQKLLPILTEFKNVIDHAHFVPRPSMALRPIHATDSPSPEHSTESTTLPSSSHANNRYPTTPATPGTSGLFLTEVSQFDLRCLRNGMMKATKVTADSGSVCCRKEGKSMNDT